MPMRSSGLRCKLILDVTVLKLFLLQNGIPATEARRPRIVIEQVKTTRAPSWHSKGTIGWSRDGTAIFFLQGSGNTSKQGYGGSSTDPHGAALPGSSHETCTMVVVPALSVLARRELDEATAFSSFLGQTGRLLPTHAKTSTPILEEAAVAASEEAVAEAEKKADLAALKAKAAAAREKAWQKRFEARRWRCALLPVTNSPVCRLQLRTAILFPLLLPRPSRTPSGRLKARRTRSRERFSACRSSTTSFRSTLEQTRSRGFGMKRTQSILKIARIATSSAPIAARALCSSLTLALGPHLSCNCMQRDQRCDAVEQVQLVPDPARPDGCRLPIVSDAKSSGSLPEGRRAEEGASECIFGTQGWLCLHF